MSNCFLFLKKKRADLYSRLFVKSYSLHHHRLLASVCKGEHKTSVVVDGDALGQFIVSTNESLHKKKSRASGFLFLYSSLFSFHSSLFSKSPLRDFSREEIREKSEKHFYIEKHRKLCYNKPRKAVEI